MNLRNLAAAETDHSVFSINIKVSYQGKPYIAVGYEYSTKRYQLRGDDNELVFAAESDLTVVSG
jgi:hypothetical protein